MPDSIVRMKEVLRRTGLSKTSLYRAMKAQLFPAPVKLLDLPESQSVGWRESQVTAWIESRKPALPVVVDPLQRAA
jgi:prophage regulatory protein